MAKKAAILALGVLVITWVASWLAFRDWGFDHGRSTRALDAFFAAEQLPPRQRVSTYGRLELPSGVVLRTEGWYFVVECPVPEQSIKVVLEEGSIAVEVRVAAGVVFVRSHGWDKITGADPVWIYEINSLECRVEDMTRVDPSFFNDGGQPFPGFWLSCCRPRRSTSCRASSVATTGLNWN